MNKNKKYWTYDSAQAIDIKQEALDALKLKGRIYDDVTALFEILGMTPHPGFTLQAGKEHAEPNMISIVNTLVDINTLKILFTILPNSKIVTLKFNSNYFEEGNWEFLINSLINPNKQNNVYNFSFEWNFQIKVDQAIISILDENLSEQYREVFNKCQQTLCKVATSPKIEALCLRGNYLGDENGKILFEYLKSNTALRILNLYKNNFSSKCFPEFCSMIEANKKLEEINIGGNYFTDADLNLFKDVVGKLPMTTEEVEQHNKRVKERDQLIEKNKKLKIQKKPEEPIPILDEISLIGETYYVMKNTRIKNFNIMQNKFTNDCFAAITHILDVNEDITVTIDGKIFDKNEKAILSDLQGKYANKLFLTK